MLTLEFDLVVVDLLLNDGSIFQELFWKISFSKGVCNYWAKSKFGTFYIFILCFFYVTKPGHTVENTIT